MAAEDLHHFGAIGRTVGRGAHHFCSFSEARGPIMAGDIIASCLTSALPNCRRGARPPGECIAAAWAFLVQVDYFRVTDSGRCQWYQKRNQSEMLTATCPAVKAAANMVPLCPFPSMAPVSGDQ
jgi:hypothetical protein